MRPPTADLSVESTLRHCELLDPLSDGQIRELAERVRMVTVREGESLFEQNDEARDLPPAGSRSGWPRRTGR